MNCLDFSGLKWAVNGKVYRGARDKFKFNVPGISGRGAEPAVATSPLAATYYRSGVVAVTDSWHLGDEIRKV